MKITHKNSHKLRCGNTVWRCLVNGVGRVNVSEYLLTGKKVEVVRREMVTQPDGRIKFNGAFLGTAPRIQTKDERFPYGHRGAYYLDDLHGHGSDRAAAFTTRREALRWKATVEADALHPGVWAALDSEMDWGYDYPYEERDYPITHYEDDEPPIKYTEPMTLGELLRKKLDAMEAAK